MLCSPGLGAGYTKRKGKRHEWKGEETKEDYYTRQGVTIGSMIPGIGTAAGGIIGGGLGLLGGLFGGGNSTKQQKELMDKAWEYEKEGMGIQYQYRQAAANEAQRRNLEMWNSTNFEQQRAHMENAKLSVG